MFCEALSRMVGALEAAHRARCECGSPHACQLSPSIWAVADALDVLVLDGQNVRGAALALHDRECGADCPSAVEDPERVQATDHARRISGQAAAAITKFHRATS